MKITPEAALNEVTSYLLENGIEFERAAENVVVAILPGEHRLKTNVSFVVGRYSMSINAFVIRNPDENHRAVYAWLLRRNQRMYAVSYAIDHHGDIYLVGKVSLASVNNDELDRILGTIHEHCDGVFDYLLELGFRSAIEREWKWRLARGESTRNLEAFRHLAGDPSGVEPVADD